MNNYLYICLLLIPFLSFRKLIQMIIFILKTIKITIPYMIMVWQSLWQSATKFHLAVNSVLLPKRATSPKASKQGPKPCTVFCEHNTILSGGDLLSPYSVKGIHVPIPLKELLQSELFQERSMSHQISLCWVQFGVRAVLGHFKRQLCYRWSL